MSVNFNLSVFYSLISRLLEILVRCSTESEWCYGFGLCRTSYSHSLSCILSPEIHSLCCNVLFTCFAAHVAFSRRTECPIVRLRNDAFL